MAQAKQCDRCRKLYEHYNMKVQRDTYNGFALCDISADGTRLVRSSGRDLCPECMGSFVRWMEDGKAENTSEQV